MIDVILQTGALILCGVLWRIFRPMGLGANTLRRSLTSLVYVLLLPALVLMVLWRAPLGLDTVRIAFAATVGVIVALLIAWLWYRRGGSKRHAVGALLLAAAFPNATYMGLPMLEAVLGPIGRDIAIQYDLFACTPLLLTAGIMLAAHYGGVRSKESPFKALLKVPPLWAAVIGVALNVTQVPQPTVILGMLDMLASGVVPLMLFSLGLSLSWAAGWWRQFPLVFPVVVIQLLLTPLLIWSLATPLGLQGPVLTGVVLEAAMPSMVLGIVLCDRFRLNTGLYAMAVTLTTALSAISLPLWFELLA